MGSLCTDLSWKGAFDCARCSVKKELLFSGIDSGYLSSELHSIDNILFEPGAHVFRKGDPGRYVYSIRAGLVKLVRQLENGSERIVRLQGPGNAFGLEAWLDQPYQNTAVVLQQLDLCRIPVAVLRSINRDRPQLSRQLQRQWEKTLETADFWIANLSTGTMRLRVTWLIRFLLDVDGCDNSTLRLLGTEDMADILGASKETVCRLMSELKHAGILSRIAPKTYTCDLAALDGYARSSSV